jgi:hypothetical protein
LGFFLVLAGWCSFFVVFVVLCGLFCLGWLMQLVFGGWVAAAVSSFFVVVFSLFF